MPITSPVVFDRFVFQYLHMATQIHRSEKFTENEILQIVEKQSRNEISWFMSEVISSQLDSVKDVLTYCLRNLDESDVIPYKLPLSSHNSEFLKGTLTRTNFKITALHMVINCPHFNGGKPFEFNMKPESYLIIRQLLDCHDSLENALFNLEKLMDNGSEESDIDLFVKYIEQLALHIKAARESLARPNPVYMFPQNRTKGYEFDPVLPPTGAIDFLINDGELTIDFKSLTIVDRKPWNMIVDTHNKLSFADIVRKQISRRRDSSMHTIISDEYTKYLEWRKNNHDETPEGLGSTIKSIFGSNSNPSLPTLLKHASHYLETSVTFVDDENKPFVVQISHKCEVVTADPVLLSMSIKLESIEKSILRIKDNISTIYQPK